MAVLIITFAIINDQRFFKVLPTIVSLIVMLLSARANRYTFLIGGCNSALYGIVYFSEGVYFAAISALFVSFPMQIFSFINWKKHSKDKFGTQLKRLPPRWLILLPALMIPAWLGAYYGLSAFISGHYPKIDSLAFVLGLLVTILSMLRFIESQYINLIACSINIVLWILISIESPNNINFVFISIYNFIMVSESVVVWTKKYISQKKTENISVK